MKGGSKASEDVMKYMECKQGGGINYTLHNGGGAPWNKNELRSFIKSELEKVNKKNSPRKTRGKKQKGGDNTCGDTGNDILSSMVLSSRTVVDGAVVESSANHNTFDANADQSQLNGMSDLYTYSLSTKHGNTPFVPAMRGGGCGCSENNV